MLSVHQITKSYNHNSILRDVSFNINPGERVGLIGPNGCGKTTLLRIFIGEERPDSGHFKFSPADLRIGYLEQGFNPDPEVTVNSLLQNAAGDHRILESKLIHISSALMESPNDPKLQLAYDNILRKIEEPPANRKLSSILVALDLDNIPKDQLTSTLSGGQKTRLALALVLLSNPQLLLLDEPTNHLDIKMLEWLEEWLKKYLGAALIVSHDRVFLDRTATRILDLDPQTKTIRSYTGNYSEYIQVITQEHQKQWQAYQDQTQDILRMKQDIARTRAQAERTEREASSVRIGGEKMKIKGYKDYQQSIAKKVARKAKSREKKLDRYLSSKDRVEKPKTKWQVKIDFEHPDHLGKQVLIIEDLAIGYPGHPPILSDVNLQVMGNQHIAFTGPNGSGKTTLLRTIAGHITPIKGQVKLGPTVKLGYMAQEQEILNPHENAVEQIQSISHLNHTETRNFLHYYLFNGDDPLRPIEQLSYGERSRLMLATLVAKGCNFLLLDEPINHLDIPSREKFEKALKNFSGAVIAVVHDRYFIKRFATEVWSIDEMKIQLEI